MYGGLHFGVKKQNFENIQEEIMRKKILDNRDHVVNDNSTKSTSGF